MTENEFHLEDRIGVIRDTVNKFGEDNFYLSYSGGKDSTVVHHLLDMALPENKIPRVFSNTGIEYNAVVEFVRELAKEDERVVILNPKQNIKKTLEKVGYPFKSKEHAKKVEQYQCQHTITKHLYNYINGLDKYSGMFGCPEKLRYQFTPECKIKISHRCCNELKKKPAKLYEKESGRTIVITGMMKEEGGARQTIDCIHFKNGKATKFHPLAKTSIEWENWFIDTYKIKLCKLYYPPFNFRRTGCKGCPFALTLSRDLETMQLLMPNERLQCEAIWRPVYEEYRRLEYRLKNEETIRLL